MRLDHRFVALGVLLVVAGAVALAAHEGMVDAGLVVRWAELWPLLLIALGAATILSRTSAAWLGFLVAATVAGVMAGGLLYSGAGAIPDLVGCGSGSTTAFTAQSGTLNGESRVDVQFDCGDLTVGTVAGSDWQLSGNDGQPPSIDASPTSVALRPSSSGLGGHGKVAWTLDVPETPPLDASFTLSAGSANLGLTGAQLDSLTATLDAGDLTAILGPTPVARGVTVTVNAGSASLLTQASAGAMDLTVNAGSLDVCIPSGAALRVQWSGTLASQDLDGLGLVKVGADTWTSNGFDGTAPHLELDVHATVGSFSLSLGGCSDA